MPSRRPTLVLVVLVVLLLALVVAVALFVATTAPTAHGLARTAHPVREQVAGAEPRDASARSAPSSVAIARKPSHDPAARDALRRDIVHTLETRGVPSTPRDSADPDRPSAADDEPGPTGAGMRNRIGGHEELMARINDDFMPLADECMEQARERRPDLTGMVAIEVELLAERDIGAIVESAESSPDNAVDDAELVECLQQSLLSMSLPGNAVDGRERFMITMPTGPDDAAPQ